jgi:hypothetical protein
MLPSLGDVRYADTDDFSVDIARSVITALDTHVHSVLPGGSVTADYEGMVTRLKPFIRIMHRESDDDLSAEVVAAVVKYWVKTGWGRDLRCDPRTNDKLLWRVAAKDSDYRNREAILPPGQATVAVGRFKEFRPYGSIPGTMRLFEGTNNWWLTDGGTHGDRAECRGADWWVWPKASRTWHAWTIGAAGVGAQGAEVAKANSAVLEDMTDREAKVIVIMRANFDDCGGDRAALFASKTIWADAEVMAA